MTLPQLFELLADARRRSGHKDYVVIGSNAILSMARATRIPDAMSISMDADVYPRSDPGRAGELAKELGENSAFHKARGFYLDAVSPGLPTLPAGWKDRLIPDTQDGVTAWFLEPNDAAISKYARGEERDRRWIRAGVAAGLVSLPTVKMRLHRTDFLDTAERERTHRLVDEDVQWFESLQLATEPAAPPPKPRSRPRP